MDIQRFVSGTARRALLAIGWAALCAVSVLMLACSSETTSDVSPSDRPRPGFEERAEERLRMVATQVQDRGVTDPAVLNALRNVPRHRFVPANLEQGAYADRPLPIGHGQTISQPYIVGLMTELLKVDAGDRVLEIGTGSGYQAAVLWEITPVVFTVEIIEALSTEATDRFAALGYSAIQTRTGDGYFGWEEEAPFDAIIVTCAAGHVPPPLLEQLKPGGRMVIPVGPVYDVQYLVVVSKDEDGVVRSERLLPVRFVPMTGRAQAEG